MISCELENLMYYPGSPFGPVKLPKRDPQTFFRHDIRPSGRPLSHYHIGFRLLIKGHRFISSNNPCQLHGQLTLGSGVHCAVCIGLIHLGVVLVCKWSSRPLLINLDFKFDFPDSRRPGNVEHCVSPPISSSSTPCTKDGGQSDR